MNSTLLKHVEVGTRIPKVIHVTYSRKELPEILAHNVRSFQKLNPDWYLRLYDDHDHKAYIGEHYGQGIFDIYSRIDQRYGPAKADLFRYLLLYNEGGCYVDVKSGMARPLNDGLRLEDQFLLAQWDNGEGGRNPRAGLWGDVAGVPGGEYQQWHVISVAGHPFLRAVILRVLENIAAYRPECAGVGKIGVLRVTGPIAYTLAIEEIRQRYPYRFVDPEKDLGISYSIFPDRGNANEHAKVFPVHYSKLTHPVVVLSIQRRIMWNVYLLGGRLSLKLQGLFGEQQVRSIVSLVKKVLRMRS